MVAAIQSITKKPPKEDGETNNLEEREDEGGREGRISHQGYSQLVPESVV